MNTEKKEKSINEVIQVIVDDEALTHIDTAETLSENIRNLKITNGQEYKNSAEVLKKIKTLSKQIDNCRKDITKPIDDLKKKVINFFKEPLLELSEGEKILKKAILTYHQQQELLRQDQAPMVEKVKGITKKKIWKAKIVDVNKIPKNVYISEEKVTTAIQSILNNIATDTKGAMEIDGVIFYQEESISAGRV